MPGDHSQEHLPPKVTKEKVLRKQYISLTTP